MWPLLRRLQASVGTIAVAVGILLVDPATKGPPRAFAVHASAPRILAAVSLSHQALRRRLPLVVCILVLLVCFAAIGATCAACVSSHPAQAIERTLASAPTATLPPDTTAFFVLALALTPLLLVRPRFLSLGRASPAEL